MKSKNYLLTIILSFSLLGLNAQDGSIIHHVPDTCYEFTGPYGEIAAFFDIDGNGSNDLAFQSFQGNMYSTWLNAVVFADWRMTMEDPAFPYPDSIPVQLDTLHYWDDTISSFIPQINVGAPSYIVTKVFLRRKVGDDYYYAWVKTNGGWNQGRVYVCVEEFAYCTIPNYPLMWGQTDLTGIEENGESFAVVHPNPTKAFVSVIGEDIRQAEVINTIGQQVLSIQGKGNEIHINMTALPAGVYFINVTDEEGRKCVRKVVKE